MQKKIYHLLLEASVFTYYGITTEEIAEELSLSRRTVIYALNHMREMNLLKECKIGRNIYRKAKNSSCGINPDK